ncbi:TonB-dependent receptor [Portibacter marinus]|uniref:TonB-dependent receptor n=1 Tax=Portibacter marinus TaxID=2898660 RepID=UPI001F1FD6E3|nr:TonB-dependent receptor [Portibacter marinus]
MTRILHIVSFLLGVVYANGQLNIEGNVKDSESGQVIINADVYLLEKDILQNGSFNFKSIEQGTYTLIVFAIGYNSREKIITLTRDTTLSFVLEKLSDKLTEVVIQDQRDQQFALQRLRAVEGTAIYAGKKSEVVRIEKMMGNIAANNSRQIYAQVAGLNIYEGNDGGLQLAIGGRGLDPNRTANFNTRQNGYDISADVLGYPESYYTPPAEALDEIQIIRGAASLQYGTQFGGLINFKTHLLPTHQDYEIKSAQTIGSFGFFNSFNRIGFRKNKWTIQGYYNYKTGNGYRENSDFNANNTFLSTKYDWNSNTSLKLEYTHFSYLAKQAGGLTDTEFATDPRQGNRSRNWFKVNWNLYHAYFRHKFSSKSEMTINLTALEADRFSLGFRGDPTDLNTNPVNALDEQDENGNYILPRDLIKGRFRNIGLEARYLTRYKIKNKRAVWLIGTKLYRARNRSQQGPGSLDTDPEFDFENEDFPDYANQSSFLFPNENVALFSENIFYINDRFSLTPGLRFEHIVTETTGEYTNVIYDNAGNPISIRRFDDNRSLPRNFMLFGIGMGYKPMEKFSLHANVSQNYRSVTFSDIRTINPTFIIDPNISDERGITGDLGFRGKVKNILSYDMGAFGIKYNDRIGIILNERANRVRKNIGNAVIYGVETLIDINLLAGREQSKLSVFSNLALTDSRYTSSDENNVVGKRVEFIPLINFKGGVNAGYQNLMASLQWTYVSSQFTDVQNSSIPSGGDSREGIIGPIPAYQIMDISMSYKWNNFKMDTGINNVLNTQYFTRRATGYPGPGIIPSDGRSLYLTLTFQISSPGR